MESMTIPRSMHGCLLSLSLLIATSSFNGLLDATATHNRSSSYVFLLVVVACAGKCCLRARSHAHGETLGSFRELLLELFDDVEQTLLFLPRCLERRF